jgi:hypothetical protein
MNLHRPSLLALVSALGLAMPLCASAQESETNTFTLSVPASVSPRDVQLRYVFSDGKSTDFGSTETESRASSVVISTKVQERQAKSLKAIVYAPGCQFATIQIDDLSATHQGEFQCQELPTVELRGKVPGADSSKEWQLQVLYACGWARDVFNVPQISLSPIALATAKVAPDGSFTANLPDFSRDPLWPSVSNDVLIFYLVDTASGKFYALSAPPELSRGNDLRVAASYPPDIEFSLVR